MSDLDPIDPSHVPDDVQEAITADLLDYFVALIGERPSGEDVPPVAPMGSGTLVRIEERHFILTAQHVWEDLSPWTRVGLTITPKESHFSIPRADFGVLDLRPDSVPWGPDLALLEIPRDRLGWIEANKPFLNLARQRNLIESPIDPRRDHWAFVGMVGAWTDPKAGTEHGSVEVEAEARAFFTALAQPNRRGEFDYYDLSADPRLSNVPRREGISTFKGMSGGGVWRVPLVKDARGRIHWNGERDLRGVAFFEEPTGEDQMIVRCHAEKSIYEVAWRRWGLPE